MFPNQSGLEGFLLGDVSRLGTRYSGLMMRVVAWGAMINDGIQLGRSYIGLSNERYREDATFLHSPGKDRKKRIPL